VKKKMRKALEASIEKWERNASVATAAQLPAVPVGGLDCPLCVACGIGEDEEAICSKCPVMRRTGKDACAGTPFYDCWRAQYFRNLADFRRHAQLEVDFLKSLLPRPYSKETKND